MTAAAAIRSAEGTPLTAFLARLDELVASDSYAEAAKAFAAFNAANPGNDFFVEEALPFKVSNHLIAKIGVPTAFMKLTLRRPTWAVELTKAFHEPETFAAYMAELEADVQKLV
ncbi:hypothetical protein [Methylobrevis pamukkalensis]|uniref:Uncharacterized protein n=1 Tax=Methylobrevis pamukkalensis TaxID=1439726 RepID=A0A1E3H311_9HYPH|nr:hypothetical protein [Methylobrevis pamukkalensis]ODN70674.1 hypothetical protein A6302_02027 [Methylobrevis pamukkalensis]